jgi:hypothetical protein
MTGARPKTAVITTLEIPIKTQWNVGTSLVGQAEK